MFQNLNAITLIPERSCSQIAIVEYECTCRNIVTQDGKWVYWLSLSWSKNQNIWIYHPLLLYHHITTPVLQNEAISFLLSTSSNWGSAGGCRTSTKFNRSGKLLATVSSVPGLIKLPRKISTSLQSGRRGGLVPKKFVATTAATATTGRVWGPGVWRSGRQTILFTVVHSATVIIETHD